MSLHGRGWWGVTHLKEDYTNTVQVHLLYTKGGGEGGGGEGEGGGGEGEGGGGERNSYIVTAHTHTHTHTHSDTVCDV